MQVKEGRLHLEGRASVRCGAMRLCMTQKGQGLR